MKAHKYHKRGKYVTKEVTSTIESWEPGEKRVALDLSETEAKWLWLLFYRADPYVIENIPVNVRNEFERSLQRPLNLTDYQERLDASRTYYNRYV